MKSTVMIKSTIVRPLELPKNHDRNFKQLELKPYF